MKNIRGRKKNNHTIIHILRLGLLVLTGCLAICLVHVIDVQNCYTRLKTDETYKNVQDASHIISDDMIKSLEIVEHSARIMETNGRELDAYGIYQFLSQFNSTDEYDQIFFLREDGNVFYDKDKQEIDINENLKKELLVNESTIRILSHELKYEDGVVYYLVPIFAKNKKVGQIVTTQKLDDLFSATFFDNLKKSGDIFLINAEGRIYAREIKRFISHEEQNQNNIFSLLLKNAVDHFSEDNIKHIEKRLKEINYGKYTFVDDNSMTNYVEIRNVPQVKGLYFAYIYPETVYSDVTQPIIFKTLITCMAIVFMTIGMLVYVWATSKNANNMVAILAYDDPITNGKNSNYFRDVAANVIWENSSIPFLVVRFDVVNFRYINEAYGHVRADELLRIISKESSKIFTGKEICTRMNADQFILLAHNDQAFEAKCEEMITIINEQARGIGIMFPIRLKRGIYSVRKDDTDISIIIDRANAARKSLNGDEKVLVANYSDKIVKQMYTVDKIESEMDSAIKNGEFKVFLQPKWDIVNDCIYGSEALVRWIKKDGTIRYPDEFIPVFEKDGFVEKLDLFMLEEVCKRLRMQMDKNCVIYPVSVNQSRILLHNPDYVNKVARILKRYRIPNGFIELEITETVFFDERNLMIRTMNKLKKLDILLSMDDFGSGYSSLNMLKDVPLDVIKIDREFFSESITSDTSIWILRKIVEMAEGLGISVLCEGVETEEQVALLRKLGCKYVQGYFYSKPVPCDEFNQKYSVTKPDVKKYYENAYARESEARKHRELMEAEAVKAQSASSAVEKWKKSSFLRSNEERQPKFIEKDRMSLSTEEKNIIMGG